MKINLKSNICFIFAALIWGLAFVAQDLASIKLEHFTINGLRCIIAFAFLIPFIIIKSKKEKIKIFEETKEQRKLTIIAGIICGICLVFAMNLQQLGISLYGEEAASSSRTGFITGLYVILVPVISVIFLKKKLNINIIISVILALIGLYLLCFGEGFEKVNIADFVNLICALCFAIQILFVDKFVKKVDGIKLSAIQLLTCGIISLVLSFIFENPNINNIIEVILPILFLGVFSSGIAYTLQIVGQKYSNNPTVDSILMSLESVFAVIGGALILEEVLEIKEIFGCLIMFVAIILSQIPVKQKYEKEVKKEIN